MIRILAQLNPAATTYQRFYTVPTGARTQVATLYACNQSGAGGSVRVAVAYLGGSVGAQTHLFYDKSVSANDTLIAENLTLGPGDSVYVRGSHGDFAFNLFGDELAD